MGQCMKRKQLTQLGGFSHPFSLKFRGQLSLIRKITETVIPKTTYLFIPKTMYESNPLAFFFLFFFFAT